MFITRQLKGLEDTKSAQFNRYFYLLEVRDLCVLISASVCAVFAVNLKSDLIPKWFSGRNINCLGKYLYCKLDKTHVAFLTAVGCENVYKMIEAVKQ